MITTRKSGNLGPRAFVAGWPITHSRSPLIHRHWLAELNIAGYYDPVALEPDDALDFFCSLAEPASPFVGGNVTLPHKQTAFRACDQLTDDARKLGAVNTLWVEDGALHGDNTDGAGFVANLDQQAPGWDHGSGSDPVVVLGAGGAARAILVALFNRGLTEITLINRTKSRALDVKADLGLDLNIVSWDQRHAALAGAKLLVNTTSLGMQGSPTLDIDLSGLAKEAIVTDLIYAPLHTALLVQAKEKGLRAVDGLGMLLHQAVPGFTRWFKTRPHVTDDLRAKIIGDLER